MMQFVSPDPVPERIAGSKRSVDSAVTNAVPRTCGTSSPSAPRGEPAGEHAAGDALLPPRLPTASSPRACSAAIFADVPVPHGERSYSPPEQSTKLRQSASSRAAGAEISMWSISRAVGAAMPAASSASWIACVKRVSSRTCAMSTGTSRRRA